MDRRLPVHTISVVAGSGDHRRSPSYGHQDFCGSDLLLSHSWLSVLMAQRVRNSRAPRPHPPSALSRGWNHPSWWWHPDRFLPRSASKGRWLTPAFGPRGPPLSEPSRRQNSRLGATPIIHGRTQLRYYSRSNDKKKGEDTAATERHNRIVSHGKPAAASKSWDITKPGGEKSLLPADRVQRQWREYQDHERMSQDILSHPDDSVGASIDGDPDEAEVVISDEDEVSESALPTTIRVPAKVADIDDDCGSVVSDLSLLDDEDEEARDDKNVGPQQLVHEEGGGFGVRVPSPGSRPPRTSARKVKISVTGTGQVPAVRPWIVPSIHHDATWGMTTTEIHDDVAWPSDEDEDEDGIGMQWHHHPRRNRAQSFNTASATASGAYIKASPATTVSLSSSSSFNSLTPCPTSHRRDLTPYASTRNAPSPVSSPEIEPSRLFRDFRKSTAATADKTYMPTHRHHRCASTQHSRNRHVLVGGSAVLVHVERRQDRSSSSRVANPTGLRHVPDRTTPSLRPNTSLTTAVS